MMNKYKDAFENLSLDNKAKEKVKGLYAEFQNGDMLPFTNNAPIRIESRKPKINSPRRMVLISLASCAVVATIVLSIVGNTHTNSDTTVAGIEVSPSSTENLVSKALSEIDHHFTIQVQAAELDANTGEVVEESIVLDEKKPTPIVNSKADDGWVLSGSSIEDDYDTIYYCISAPLRCSGDGIAAITYSVNKGFFQIVDRKDSSIVIAGEPLEPPYLVGQIGGGTDESEEIYDEVTSFAASYYKSFTVSYDEQGSDHTWINLCGESTVQGYWDWDNRPELPYLEDLLRERDSMRTMLDGVVITCTVTYDDGTTDSEDVKIGAEVLSYKEAGQYVPPEELAELPEEERYTIYITYELN